MHKTKNEKRESRKEGLEYRVIWRAEFKFKNNDLLPQSPSVTLIIFGEKHGMYQLDGKLDARPYLLHSRDHGSEVRNKGFGGANDKHLKPKPAAATDHVSRVVVAVVTVVVRTLVIDRSSPQKLEIGRLYVSIQPLPLQLELLQGRQNVMKRLKVISGSGYQLLFFSLLRRLLLTLSSMQLGHVESKQSRLLEEVVFPDINPMSRCST